MIPVRPADPREYERVGALTVEAYAADGLLDSTEGGYADQLRDAARRAAEAELLVAIDGDRLVGTATFCRFGSPWAELATPAESEFRMLAVSGDARGKGVARALLTACVERARAAGSTALVLSTLPAMSAATSVYGRFGFAPAPERNWSPAPGVDLLAYRLPLGYCEQCGEPPEARDHSPCGGRRELEPPRWCPACRRRIVVQVTPRGWTARCVEHGTRTSAATG